MRKITENINGREDITIDSTAIKMVIREYYELNANKFNNLDKLKKCLNYTTCENYRRNKNSE